MTRQQRRHRLAGKRRLMLCGLLAGLILAVWSWTAVDAPDEAAPAFAEAGRPASGWIFPGWRDVLFAGVPGLRGAAAQKEDAVFDAGRICRGVLLLCVGVDSGDWRSVLTAEIPVLATVKTGPPAAGAALSPHFPKFDAPAPASPDKPLVAVYHTHTAESFIPSSGVAHSPGGTVGDIAAVGARLVSRLEELGVPAVQDTTIHDYPSFMKAYGASEITARRLLKEYPSIQMIFDIHRDAAKRSDSTIEINGQPAAKMTIIVAVGQDGLPQPHWKQNHAFAKLIDAKLTQYYPGLCKGIQLVEWRYNQHLHPRALLIEVGGQENSKEEAERSMEYLANVLAEIIKEGK